VIRNDGMNDGFLMQRATQTKLIRRTELDLRA